MEDKTEGVRRHMVAEINSNAAERTELEQKHGQVWDTNELRRDYEIHDFAAPFVVVTRRSDSAKGSIMFQHSPRLYFGFEPASKSGG